jgi:dipeptidyl aminopeptidase/acylaminoacyl peptidase
LATVAPVPVSEEISPVKTVTASAADGNQFKFVYRAPKADRPLPAIMFVHGGLGQQPPVLKWLFSRKRSQN